MRGGEGERDSRGEGEREPQRGGEGGRGREGGRVSLWLHSTCIIFK